MAAKTVISTYRLLAVLPLLLVLFVETGAASKGLFKLGKKWASALLNPRSGDRSFDQLSQTPSFQEDHPPEAPSSYFKFLPRSNNRPLTSWFLCNLGAHTCPKYFPRNLPTGKFSEAKGLENFPSKARSLLEQPIKELLGQDVSTLTGKDKQSLGITKQKPIVLPMEAIFKHIPKDMWRDRLEHPIDTPLYRSPKLSGKERIETSPLTTIEVPPLPQPRLLDRSPVSLKITTGRAKPDDDALFWRVAVETGQQTISITTIELPGKLRQSLAVTKLDSIVKALSSPPPVKRAKSRGLPLRRRTTSASRSSAASPRNALLKEKLGINEVHSFRQGPVLIKAFHVKNLDDLSTKVEVFLTDVLGETVNSYISVVVSPSGPAVGSDLPLKSSVKSPVLGPTRPPAGQYPAPQSKPAEDVTATLGKVSGASLLKPQFTSLPLTEAGPSAEKALDLIVDTSGISIKELHRLVTSGSHLLEDILLGGKLAIRRDEPVIQTVSFGSKELRIVSAELPQQALQNPLFQKCKRILKTLTDGLPNNGSNQLLLQGADSSPDAPAGSAFETLMSKLGVRELLAFKHGNKNGLLMHVISKGFEAIICLMRSTHYDQVTGKRKARYFVTILQDISTTKTPETGLKSTRSAPSIKNLSLSPSKKSTPKTRKARSKRIRSAALSKNLSLSSKKYTSSKTRKARSKRIRPASPTRSPPLPPSKKPTSPETGKARPKRIRPAPPTRNPPLPPLSKKLVSRSSSSTLTFKRTEIPAVVATVFSAPSPPTFPSLSPSPSPFVSQLDACSELELNLRKEGDRWNLQSRNTALARIQPQCVNSQRILDLLDCSDLPIVPASVFSDMTVESFQDFPQNDCMTIDQYEQFQLANGITEKMRNLMVRDTQLKMRVKAPPSTEHSGDLLESAWIYVKSVFASPSRFIYGVLIAVSVFTLAFIAVQVMLYRTSNVVLE